MKENIAAIRVIKDNGTFPSWEEIVLASEMFEKVSSQKEKESKEKLT